MKKNQSSNYKLSSIINYQQWLKENKNNKILKREKKLKQAQDAQLSTGLFNKVDGNSDNEQHGENEEIDWENEEMDYELVPRTMNSKKLLKHYLLKP